MVKNPPANAGEASDAGLIPGSGRSPGVGNAACSSILAWEIPWTEKPMVCSPWGCKELDTTEGTEYTHTNARTHLHTQCLSHKTISNNKSLYIYIYIMFVFYYNINKYIIQPLRGEGFDPCVGKIPLEEELATYSNIFA